MKVSLNELQSVCRKAFLGMGFSEGHADDAAAMVAWMQSHGLDGLKALNDGLECVMASSTETQVPPTSRISEAGSAIVKTIGSISK